MRALVYTALAAQTVIAAVTFLVAKRAVTGFAPLEAAVLRFALSSLIFATVLVAARLPLLPPRGARLRYLALGALGVPLNQALFLSGLALSTPAHAAILYALTPACVMAIGRVVQREPIPRSRAAGIGLAFVGVLVVLLDHGLLAVRQPLTGDLLILVAVLAWSAFTVIARPLTRRDGAVASTAWAMLGGTLLVLPAAPFVLRAPAVLLQVDATAWACVLFLAAGSSVLAYLLWGFALRHLEASRVAVFGNLQPVGTALLAWAAFGDRLSVQAMVGGALVIAGVATAQRS